MRYVEKFKISVEELKHYNELLQLDLEEDLPFYNKDDIERLGARKNDYIGIATITFKNGNFIGIDVASGDSNYYDNIVLYDKYETELYVLDCDYKIDSFEFTYDNDTYVIEIETY